MAKLGRVAIDFGTSAVKLIQIGGRPDAPKIEKIDAARIQNIDTENADVFPKAAVVAALKELLSRSKLKLKKVAITIPGQAAIIRTIKIPGEPGEKMAQMVRYEAEPLVPFPLDECAFGFKVIQVVKAEGEGSAGSTKVLFIAVKNERIHDYVDALHEVGIIPELIEVAPFSSANGFRASAPLETDAVALVDFGEGTSDISVIRGGELEFTRAATVAGITFTQALQSKLGIARGEAERLKRDQVRISAVAQQRAPQRGGQRPAVPGVPQPTGGPPSPGRPPGAPPVVIPPPTGAPPLAGGPPSIPGPPSAIPPPPAGPGAPPPPAAGGPPRPPMSGGMPRATPPGPPPPSSSGLMGAKPPAPPPGGGIPTGGLMGAKPPSPPSPPGGGMMTPPKPPGPVGPPPPPSPPSGGQEAGASALPGEASRTSEDPSAIVQPLAERLLAEIRRSLEYYTSQEDGVAVTKMYITGGAARLNGLKEFLAARLNLEVIELDALANAKVAVSVDEPAIYQAGYGLALRLLNPAQVTVNLLPSDLLARIAEGTKAVWTKYLSILAILLVAEGVGWCWISYYGRKTQVDTLRAEFEGEVRPQILINGRPVLNKEVLEKMAEIQLRRDQLDERFKTIRDLEVTRYDWIAIMEAIRKVIPENAWVSDARFEFGGAGLTLNMKTTVEDNPRVMLKNVQASDFLAFGGTGINVQKSREGGVDLWSWQVPVTFEFKPIGSADEMGDESGVLPPPAGGAE